MPFNERFRPRSPHNTTIDDDDDDGYVVFDNLADALVRPDSSPLQQLSLYGSNAIEVRGILRTLSHMAEKQQSVSQLTVQIFSTRTDLGISEVFWGTLQDVVRSCRVQSLRLAIAKLEWDPASTGQHFLQSFLRMLCRTDHTLRSLIVTGTEPVVNIIQVLEEFATIFPTSPQLRFFEFDYPGIPQHHLKRIFGSITTLEDVRVGRTVSIDLVFCGLRNRIRHVLEENNNTDATTVAAATTPTSTGTTNRRQCSWNPLMNVLLQWYSDNTIQTEQQRGLDMKSCHDIFLSGLWYAMIEYPILITELGVYMEHNSKKY